MFLPFSLSSVQTEVTVFPDSNRVDTSKLKEGEAKMQITYITPYFEESEAAIRRNRYEQNTNLSEY